MKFITMKLLAALLLMVCCVGARSGEPDLVLFDFENAQQAIEHMDRVTLVGENATQGKTAGRVKLDQPFAPNFGFWGGANQSAKWSSYDQFILDVFVEGGPVSVTGFIKDANSPGWWERHNFDLKLAPGKRRVAFSLGSLTRQNGKGSLDLKALEFFAITFSSEDPKQVATIYLDNGRLVKGTGAFEVKVLFSFEGDDAGKILLEDYPEEFKGKSSMTPVEEHATHGKKAMKLESHATSGNIQFTGFEKDWSKYDCLAIDVFNPSDKPMQIGGWVRSKDMNQGWFERFNYDRMVKPGFSTMRFSTGAMTGPDGGKPLDMTDIVRFNIGANQSTVFIDNVRLIKGTEEIPVAGLKKFDCGPAKSAVMPGFTAVSREEYSKERGWGWMPGAQFGRDFDMNEMLGRHRPPDDLCRDFLQPTKATFAVDVPDGEYGVWVMMGPPGNGWGATFQHRSVNANGKPAIDNIYTPASYKEYEFRMQDAEDLPGDDLWEKYIRPIFQGQRFDVTVTGGQLKLDFDSYGGMWTTMLNGFALWPKTSDKDAERWLANLDAARKEQYQAQHVEKLPDAPPAYAATDAEKKAGYALFLHSPDRDVTINAVPTGEEVKRQVLDIAAAPGEPKDACFGIYALKDCGALKATFTPLSGPDGASISPANIQLLVSRFKALNFTAVYTPTPKYLDNIPAEGVVVRPGVTRSFWYVVSVPEDAKPGDYKGQVNIELAGQKKAIDVKVTVWPVKLATPEFPMGMFMMNPAWNSLNFDEELRWAAIKEMLVDAKKHGLTSIDPSLSFPLKSIKDGKADIDFTQSDRYMKLIREAGFTQELNGYGVNCGFNIRVQGDEQAEANRFGVKNYGELVKAYFDAFREHAKANNYLPIAFCTDDEYIVHPGGEPERLAAHHRVLQQNAPGFHFVTYDSVYLEEQPKTREAREKMLADIDTWGSGIHGPREAEVIKKAGRRFWLYNTGMNRFTFGTYMYFARTKYDVTGFFQWVYPNIGTYHPFYLASHNEGHYGVVYPSTHGLRSTVTWERIRAGCYDHRYLETARQLIAQAKKDGKGTAEADALQKLIDGTMAKLKFGNPRADAYAGEGRADNPLTPENMETFRRDVAAGVVKLQSLLK